MCESKIRNYLIPLRTKKGNTFKAKNRAVTKQLLALQKRVPFLHKGSFFAQRSYAKMKFLQALALVRLVRLSFDKHNLC